MRSFRDTNLLVVAIVTLTSAFLIAKAGDINPPPGPITGTMRTLDEIHTAFKTAQVGSPGQLVSYTEAGINGFTIIPSVPAGGFVLTDMITMNSSTYTIMEDGVIKIDFGGENSAHLGHIHLNSGIFFVAGSVITVGVNGASSPRITLSGYIPN